MGGLSFLLYVGSPPSKESPERMEAKIDVIIQSIRDDPERVRQLLQEIEEKYPKK